MASSRTRVVTSVRALHSSFDSSSVEFYSWAKLDASTHKVTFRAPADQKDLLLAASGVQVSFIINLFCRDDASRATRDAGSSVVWLGKLGYTDSLAWIKQLDGHLGLALSHQSFGIRCVPSALAAVRRLVLPKDSKYLDANIKIRGVLRYTVSGLPIGCTRSEIIKRFFEWKWAIIPVKQWTTAGQCHWLVRADTEPPSHCYMCKSGRVLIQPAPPESFVPKARPSSVPRASSQAPADKPKPKPSTPAPVNPQSALTARVLAVENRLDVLEARSANIETELRAGFSQILARLDDRSSSSARRPAVDQTGETPPPKTQRSAQAKATGAVPALADQT